MKKAKVLLTFEQVERLNQGKSLTVRLPDVEIELTPQSLFAELLNIVRRKL